MPQNESALDRVIRAILGVVIIFFVYASFSGVGAVIGYVVGAMLVLTAITGYCLMYKLLGISTKK